MKQLIRKMARVCIPAAIHRYLYVLYWRHKNFSRIRDYYLEHGMNQEIGELLKRLSKDGNQPYLYPWAKQQSVGGIEVSYDDATSLPFVITNGKRLYFPRTMTVEEIRQCYGCFQLVEQHVQSPHRYLSDNFDVDENDCVVDCGAAEGNFSLSVVDRVSRVYLFEADEKWIEALNATFAPWKDKVEIVQKYVSDADGETTVSLDSFFAGTDSPTFLKMDVEGCEKKALDGAHRILTESVKKVAVCAYHYAHDEEVLTKAMHEHSFSVEPAQGYMLFDLYDDDPPYFRRGVLRCSKKQ